VNRAKVIASTRCARRNGEFLVRVEWTRFLEFALNADDKVRFFVPIDPRDLFPGFYGEDLRIEVEILNHYFVLFGVRCFFVGLA